MRVILIIGWLFVALGGAIFHMGPGREQAKLDRLDALLRDAERAAENKEWERAVKQYDLALADIPEGKTYQAQQVILEKSKAQMMARQLPDARRTLEQLLQDVMKDPNSPHRFVADVESTLASAQFYMTWLMRLEGLPKEEWLPEIESARQHYTQVIERGAALEDAALVRCGQEDLEAAVRLARMDLSELQSLPLPSQ